MKNLIFLILSFLFFPTELFAFLSVDVSIDKNEVLPGQTIEMDLLIKSSENVKDPVLPDMPFAVTGRGSSTNFSFINGNTTIEVHKTFTLKALSEGSYEIPPIAVKSGEKSVTTGAIPVKVVNSSGYTGKSSPAQVHGFVDIVYLAGVFEQSRCVEDAYLGGYFAYSHPCESSGLELIVAYFPDDVFFVAHLSAPIRPETDPSFRFFADFTGVSVHRFHPGRAFRSERGEFYDHWFGREGLRTYRRRHQRRQQ